MTRITYGDTKLYQELTLSGHAEDRIVCAGISAVSQTLIANLLKEESAGRIRLQWQMATPGEIWIRAWPGKENRDGIRAMFLFTMTGLKQIGKDYPGNLETREEEKNGDV